MKTQSQAPRNFQTVFDTVLRLAIVFLLALWSYLIIKPFLIIIVWGAILAVSNAPVCNAISRRLGGKSTIAAILSSLALLLVIIVPSYFLADSLASGIALVRENWDEGMVSIPPPTEKVRDIPIVGKSVFRFWASASDNLGRALEPLAPHLKSVGGWILSAVTGAGVAVIQFVFAIIISGVMLANAEKCGHALEILANRLEPNRGLELLRDAATTVRGVTRGILGVAFIQAVLTGIGLALTGIPGAGLWTLFALILGIIQIGVAPVLILAILYLFSTAGTLKASLFLIWAIIIIPLDNILKPLLLGRGAAVPVLVVFLGALGGFIGSGIIGLFIGAIVLALSYKLLLAWLEERPEAP